ncbi:hydroxyacid dehydrogenase [Gimesia maris]|uniref:D-3-phosphoglycerate dehydrogenase n=1 Tax=Gimesia maris TaxID=122 RepID=A0ABX5YJS7_9PLAN|nr:hydroxyacid dehydrogenase [Gimesia maris]EDL61253.1 phosphoglycerate dehydrogenase (serA) [Gimesia maris DSM 8797]QEG15892.1 D-3-phosphoglycerate dehydrogenase [Gimesia maris]QGQ30845.1 hydroxyacid dehydrogenase [Gimesia maris]
MSDVLVTENIQGVSMNRLIQEHDVEFDAYLWQNIDLLKQKIQNTRALIVRNQTKVDRELIDAAPELKIIARAGAGLDNVDTEYAHEKGIVVCFTPDANSLSVAELTIGLMLALMRKIPEARQDTLTGGWNRLKFTGTELYGKSFGLIGLGRIGSFTATRAKAFGMNILAADPFLKADAPQLKKLNATLLSLDDLLAESDVVSCHSPLTPDTRKMLTYQHFRKMKPDAFFINTSRGEVVDERGLTQALLEHKLAGAALDVRETEPPKQSPLNQMENVILTPHIAAFTVEAQDRVVDSVCEDVRLVLSGKKAINVFEP